MGESLKSARAVGAEVISPQDFAQIEALGGWVPASGTGELPTAAPQVRKAIGGISKEEEERIERLKNEFFVPGC